MIGTMRTMLTCHWTARRIQRYLDADPSAPLSPGEVTRLEQHVATCARCQEVARQHRVLHRALSWWSGGAGTDPAAVERLRTVLDDLVDGRRA